MNETIERVRKLQDVLRQSTQIAGNFRINVAAVIDELNYICGLLHLEIRETAATGWDEGYGFGVLDQMEGLRQHENPYRSKS